MIAVGDNDMTWNRTVLTGTASASTIWRFIITTAAVRWAAICATCWRVRSTTSASTATSKLPGGAADGSTAQARDQRVGSRYPRVATMLDRRSAVWSAADERLRTASDLVAMSAVSDLVNGWPGGIIQAGRHGVFVTPIYLVSRLYATHLGAERLATRRRPDARHDPRGQRDPGAGLHGEPVGRRSQDFRESRQYGLHWPLSARVELRGAQVSPDAIVKRVVADSLSAVNDFATPKPSESRRIL